MADFREKNEELRRDYQSMASDIDVILDRVDAIVNGLNDLDYDIEKVSELVEDAKFQYDGIKETSIMFLTESAGDEDGTF